MHLNVDNLLIIRAAYVFGVDIHKVVISRGPGYYTLE
jgi:hypothetical protein